MRFPGFFSVLVMAAIFVLAFSSFLPLVRLEGKTETNSNNNSNIDQQNQHNQTETKNISISERFRSHYQRFFPTNETYDSMLGEKLYFLKEFSSQHEYGYDGKVEEIVATQLERFAGNVYCDYTGSGVYQTKQLQRNFEELQSTMFGNAHSTNPSALNTDSTIENTRRRIAKFFNTNLSEYSVIFTSGATGGLKLVAESFPWTNSSRFVYLRSNHNSVLGIREVALDQGADFIPIDPSALDDDQCHASIGGWGCKETGSPKKGKRVILTDFPDQVFNLFAFPAQDNFAGVKYPLEWINKFKSQQLGDKTTGRWVTLLDAAAFVPSNSLNLTQYPADFVTVSFYKMFGYPTGLGVLLVRNEIVPIMQKTFFGGGTVISAVCESHFCMLSPNPCQKFEDGTVNFLGINALKFGFDVLEEIGMDRITQHIWSLTSYLYDRLASLTHKNGSPVVKIFGNHSLYDKKKQGGIINLIVFNPFGETVGYHSIQQESAAAGIHLRTGCSCNPGACYGFLGVSVDDVIRLSKERQSCHDETDTLHGKPLGGVRISFGYLSTFEDAFAIFEFFRNRYVDRLD